MTTLIQCLGVLLAVSPLTAAGQVDRTISVSGDAEVRVAPNQVQLMLQVVTIDKSLTKAPDAPHRRQHGAERGG